jgi:nitrate reductase assembly molybdenum cofactor insertion protein NarJ
MALNFYKAMSVLLEYPTLELHDNLPALHGAVAESDSIDAAERDVQAHMRASDVMLCRRTMSKPLT